MISLLKVAIVVYFISNSSLQFRSPVLNFQRVVELGIHMNSIHGNKLLGKFKFP